MSILPRTYARDGHEEVHRQRMKRVEANDPVAMCQEGNKQHNEGNYSRAFEYFTKATELGSPRGHYGLSTLYRSGQGVEMDKGKVMHHLEEAAIAGHPTARYFLGSEELKNKNYERVVKHWFIAAAQGDDESIKTLVTAFRYELVSKVSLLQLSVHTRLLQMQPRVRRGKQLKNIISKWV